MDELGFETEIGMEWKRNENGISIPYDVGPTKLALLVTKYIYDMNR